MNELETERLIPLPKVMEITGFKRSYIYSKMLQNKFPKNVKIGKHAVRWKLSEVENWVKQYKN